MPIFGEVNPNSRSFFEAKILAVDSVRMVCKVKTSYGQSLDNVRWLSGTEEDILFGKVVLITLATGSPIILGVLPELGSDKDLAASVDTGELEADTGNYSSMGSGVVNNPDKPGDYVAGDRLFYNDAGGIFGLLRGGGFLAKASKLAQIFVTKYDDLVRIVARNFEIFTDVFEHIVANVRGRIYEYKGYSDTHTNVRGAVYKYDEAFGDTVLGTMLKGNYYGYTPETFSALAAPDDVIRKYRVLTAAGSLLMKQDLHLTGQYYTMVQNSGGTAYTYVDQTNAIFDVKTLNGTYTRITTTKDDVVITYNGSNIITVDANKIKLDYNAKNTVVVENNDITLNYGPNLTVVSLNSTGITMTGAGHGVTIDNTGTHWT